MSQTDSRKTVLHIGCGRKGSHPLHPIFAPAQWRELRLDIDPVAEPDIVANMIDMKAVATSSVDAIWSSHNLEHLLYHEVALALREFHRVIKPGGFAFIWLPDIQAVAEEVAKGRIEEPLIKTQAGPISAIDILYGHRPSIQKGNLFMCHRTGFTARSIQQKMREAGFDRVKVSRDRSNYTLSVGGYKPQS